MNKKIRELVWERDAGRCWHCGREDELVIHHRQNRGMGGSKLLDRPSNLVLLCSEYNILIESYLPAARESRNRGIKISREASPMHTPIRRFDNSEWLLDDWGKKHPVNPEPF